MCVVCVYISAQRYIREDEDCDDYIMYDLDELDLNWLESVNTKRKLRGQHSVASLLIREYINFSNIVR